MENLLCNEVWLMSPNTAHRQTNNDHHCTSKSYGISSLTSFYMTEEECEEWFRICIDKELSYMPNPGYVNSLQSSELVNIPRLKAIQRLIKSQKRLNLSFGTIFNAANYFDRFVSANHCHSWKFWMVELLSVACLSIASKFCETDPPPLHAIQMEDLDHSFQSSMIERMELTVLKALKWRLGCTTAFSYIEMLTWNIDFLKPVLLDELTSRVIDLLLSSLLDYKLLEFRPCVIAISALRCMFEELLPSTNHAHYLAYVTSLIPQDQKDDLIKCHKFMEERLVDQIYKSMIQGHHCPSSPDTVLTIEQVDINDCRVDLSLFKMPGLINFNGKSNMKRKRE